MQTLKQQDWTECFCQYNVDNAKFNVKPRLEHDFAKEYTYFQMIITVCTLLLLLQLIKRFKLHVVKKRNLRLFSWGNIHYTTRISAYERIEHVVSMNFTHFHGIVLQHLHFHCNMPNGLILQTLQKQDCTECSWRHNVYNAKFNVKPRLEHDFDKRIYVFPNDYNCLHTIITITAYNAL